MKSWIYSCALALTMAVASTSVMAQANPSTPMAVSTAKEAAATEFDPLEHKRVLGISNQLRCLVCQNQSIADSNAELAVDLRNQVIQQIKDGRTDQQIIDYMVERYGDFVLYNPPFKASTMVLWLGPVILFLIAFATFYINLKRRKKGVTNGATPLSPDQKRKAEAMLRSQKDAE